MNQTPFVKPISVKCYKNESIYGLYDENLITTFDANMLTGEYWLQQQKVVGQAQGRGVTYFISHNDQAWVLKHYYRGGLIGKIIHDSYWFTGHENTRAAKEFSLLATMYQSGLPVPRPVAIRNVKRGLFYQADLMTTRIENAQDLVGILQHKKLTALQWQHIGHMLAKFHQQGIYHHDLNCHNILLDQDDKAWLIDFDRGEQRDPQGQWQQANIDRLHRSFVKELNRLSSFHWSEADWQALLSGYTGN